MTENHDLAWRDVPVTFGELYDILRTMPINVNAGVAYTSLGWRESIRHTAQLKLNRMEEQELNRRIDRLHGPGASAALDAAIADGTIFND